MFAAFLPLLAAFFAQDPESTLSVEEFASRYGDRWTAEARVYRQAGPTVVSLDVFAEIQTSPWTRSRRSRIGQGTGVVIDPSGLVISNAHVVAPPNIRMDQPVDVLVSFGDDFGGEQFSTEILSIDEESDLALLKILSNRRFRAIPLGTSEDLLPGEKVIAIGSPYGNSHSITSGILSGLNRDVQINNAGRGVRMHQGLIQTDAAINLGNSGGPLLNIYGQLIGINLATNVAADNLGFAIPVDRVRAILGQRLLDVDRSPRFWAGMSVQQVDSEAALAVELVHPRGPASAAGVHNGDQVIAVDGRRVLGLEDYAKQLLPHAAGDEVTLTVRRPGETRERACVVRLRPARDRDTFGLLGFRATAQVRYTGRGWDRQRVRVLEVNEVYEGTGAKRLGLQTGDLLLAIRVKGIQGQEAWRPVTSQAELLSYVRSSEFDWGRNNVWVLRNGEQSMRGQLTVDDPSVQLEG